MQIERADCANHDVNRESYISYDGTSPKGLLFTSGWQEETNGALKPDKFARLLELARPMGEGGDLIPEEICLQGQTAIQSTEIHVEVEGSSNPFDMVRSFYLPSGFIIEKFKDREGSLHHWDIYMAPQMDRRSQMICEETLFNLGDDVKDEAIEETSELWPTCEVGENEGITFVMGDGRYMLEIDEGEGFLQVVGGAMRKSHNSEDGSQDFAQGERHHEIRIKGKAELINGKTFLRYETRVRLDKILPLDLEPDDVLASWRAVIGVSVRYMDFDDLEFELRKLIERGTVTQKDLNQYVIPFMQIIDPNLNEA